MQLHTVEAGEPGAPVVVLAHGFPELAYSWRHQIPALAAAGYHVLAPDQRGYGRSTRPADIADYNVADLSADLIGLLDDVGADKAVFIGHDWGAPVVWGSAQLHPDRVAAVVGLSVPPVPRAQVPPTQAFRAIFGDNFFYMLYFQEPGVADAELDADPARTITPDDGRPARSDDQAAGLRMIRPGPAGFIERLPEPDGAAGLDQRARSRPLRRRVHPHRLHRRAELVPQSGPQLGDHGRPAGRHHRRARHVHRRHRRPGARVSCARDRATEVVTGPLPRGADRRRRALAAAGTPGPRSTNCCSNSCRA